MSRALLLSEADKAFKEAMLKLNSIKSSIEILDKENYLLSVEREKLEDNIDYLKKQGVVPLAQEYRKIKQELAIIRNRVHILEKDRDSHYKVYSDTEKLMNNAKAKLEKIQKGLDNNVLKFKSRK